MQLLNPFRITIIILLTGFVLCDFPEWQPLEKAGYIHDPECQAYSRVCSNTVEDHRNKHNNYKTCDGEGTLGGLATVDVIPPPMQGQSQPPHNFTMCFAICNTCVGVFHVQGVPTVIGATSMRALEEGCRKGCGGDVGLPRVSGFHVPLRQPNDGGWGGCVCQNGSHIFNAELSGLKVAPSLSSAVTAVGMGALNLALMLGLGSVLLLV